MSVQQFYYTSYIHMAAGTSGFQMKAMSPGIPPDLQMMLTRLAAYRVPPALDVTQTEMHPIALRYHYKTEQECILLCSQSSGADEFGRPGNFFAHGLVLEHDLFTCIPPIFFWKSPFWQKQDLQERAHVTSLPILYSFDEEPMLDLEDVWRFLVHDNRRALLHKLLCAVISSGASQRRIVIIDEVEHTVMWIAAVSCLLPPAYRPLLTFATFHHNPYQSLSLITGTTSTPFFRATAEEYQSFFILNAETGATSNVHPSSYADLVVEFAEPVLYETKLLPLFSNYTQRFSYTPAFDEQLDHLASYSSIVLGHSRDPLTAQERRGLEIALSSFELLDTFAQADSDELSHIARLLRERNRVANTTVLEEGYLHIIALLQKDQQALDALLLDELTFGVEQMMVDEQSITTMFSIQMLCQIYGEGRVLNLINSVHYLQLLLAQMEDARYEQLCAIWRVLAGFIHPTRDSLALLLISLRMVVQLWKQQRINEMCTLLQSLLLAVKERSHTWLQLLLELDDHVPFEILSCLCQGLEGFPLSTEEHVS